MKKKLLRIATRESPLALWQANFVRDLLLKFHPELTVELLPMTTAGDKFLKDQLQALGGKGLFVKELEEAILDGRADIAVHSMKDVPSQFPDSLDIPIICKRHNPLDAFISPQYQSLENLPSQATVGTTSLRRQSQLLALRPDIQVKPLRGNIHTRLRKLEEGDYDAILLAAAGLERMGLHQHIKTILNEDIMLPACGQGALGIECKKTDLEIRQLLGSLNDKETALCVTIERAVNGLLGGNCHVPVAVYCKIINANELILKAKVADPKGTQVISNTQIGALSQGSVLAEACVNHLLANGANILLNL